MNVDLPAPFGPATTTRAGPSAAAARSDANGGTLTTWNEPAPVEPPARPAAVRRHLDHALGILGVGAIDRRSRRADRSEEHTSELQSRRDLVCRLLLEKKKKQQTGVSTSKKKNT